MDTNTLANALKSVFGNNTTDNPSSSSKIPYCDSNGLPAGLASMGNLASVLGVNDRATILNAYGLQYIRYPEEWELVLDRDNSRIIISDVRTSKKAYISLS